MDGLEFIKLCSDLVRVSIDESFGDEEAPDFTVFPVWSCKTLQNNKAILSASIKGAPLYEFTYNGDLNELYIDTYIKSKNEKIVL